MGIVHSRRRKVLNIGGAGGVGGGGDGARFRILGGGGGGARWGHSFRWLKTNWSPRSQSVPNNYISHIEN